MNRKIGRCEIAKAFASSMLVALVVVALVVTIGRSSNRESSSASVSSEESAQLPGGNSIPTGGLAKAREFSAAEALSENTKLPFSTEPIEPAMPFYLSKHLLDPLSRKRATDCLASAIYYEAGFQSEQEKRAVAQVVLNRVRHPAFPTSLCEVVYQGSERVTGCQFTFTCDGSEEKRPEKKAWLSARAVALAILEGSVEKSVGMATHFHADYVQPYWAPNLTKIEQVGRHIFYRWNGSWGRRAAFRQVPQEGEPNIEGLSELVPIEAFDEVPVQQKLEQRSAIVEDGKKISPQRGNSTIALPVSKGDLIADEADTGLIVDEIINSKD